MLKSFVLWLRFATFECVKQKNNDMKTFYLSLMCLAAALLAGCDRNDGRETGLKIYVRDSGGSRTETSVDGDGVYRVSWKAGDRISVFVFGADADLPLENNSPFVYDEASGAFINGSVSLSPGQTYRYAAVYPYDAALGWGSHGSFAIPEIQTQQAGNPLAHLSGLDCLIGETRTAGVPSIPMSHLGAMLRVTLHNPSGASRLVESLSVHIDGVELSGGQEIDFAAGAFVPNPSPAVATGVTLAFDRPVEVAPGAEYDGYLMVAPRRIDGAAATISVVTDAGIFTETRTLSDVEFAAGTVNDARFELTGAPVLARWSGEGTHAFPFAAAVGNGTLRVVGGVSETVTCSAGEVKYLDWSPVGYGEEMYWQAEVPAAVAPGDRFVVGFSVFGEKFSPRDWRVQASVDGVGWTELGTYAVTATTAASAEPHSFGYLPAEAGERLFFRLCPEGDVSVNDDIVDARNGASALVGLTVSRGGE